MDLIPRTLVERKDRFSPKRKDTKIIFRMMLIPFMTYHVFHIPPTMKIIEQTMFKIKPNILYPLLLALNFHKLKKVKLLARTRPMKVPR